MDAFTGEVRIFGGSYAPQGWAFCQGQTLPISQYPALFSLLGTTYGGDGRTNFGLPDLRSRVPMSQGQGPNLTNRPLGSASGVEKVTLLVAQIPSHTHPLAVSSATANGNINPFGQVPAAGSVANTNSYAPPPSTGAIAMADQMIQPFGGNSAHENRMPFMAVNFIICLNGLFPSNQ